MFEAVFDALDARGIDVNDTLESGVLSVHMADDTYRHTSEFDHDRVSPFSTGSTAASTTRRPASACRSSRVSSSAMAATSGWSPS